MSNTDILGNPAPLMRAVVHGLVVGLAVILFLLIIFVPGVAFAKHVACRCDQIDADAKARAAAMVVDRQFFTTYRPYGGAHCTTCAMRTRLGLGVDHQN